MTRRQRGRIIAAGMVGAVALIAAGALAWVWAWPRLYPSTLEQGRAAYGRREWTTAAFQALRVLKETPDDRDALRLLAWSSGRLGQDDTTRSIYKQLGLDSLGPEDCLVIAASFQHQGDLGSAFHLLEKGHNLDPDHPDLLHDLSRYCASMDRLIRAEELAARLAGQPGQGARAEVLLGSIRDRLSDPIGAAEALERALRLDPTLKDLDPGPLSARKLLARNDLKVGKFTPARDQLRQVLEAGPDPEASWLLSRTWLQEGRFEEATSAAKAAGTYGEDHPLAFEPAPLVGSIACAGCHEAIHRSQQSSRHARTYMTGKDLARLTLPAATQADPADPKAIDHTARRVGDRVDWESRVEGTTARAIIEHAFGSGDRGVTPVGRDEAGRLREIRLSRFGEIDAWDVTAGHPTRPDPCTAEETLGRLLTADELRNCLGCHTTDPRAARDRVGPTAMERGIGCERCHGPGGNHLESVAAGFADPAIARPKRANAEQVTRLCAECHSPTTRTVRPSDPDAVRFQGTTLTWSRCYQESRGGMSCVTCHDPHRDASRSTAIYEAKCLACHPAGRLASSKEPESLPSLEGKVQGATCPVNPSSGCVKCHMPSIGSAVPHTTFTDHQIRVHRPANSSP